MLVFISQQEFLRLEFERIERFSEKNQNQAVELFEVTCFMVDFMIRNLWKPTFIIKIIKRGQIYRKSTADLSFMHIIT